MFFRLISLGIFFFFTQLTTYSQRITGTVTTQSGKPATSCYILVEKYTTQEVVDYVVPNLQGKYDLLLKAKDTLTLLIRVQGLAYYPQAKKLHLVPSKEFYTLDFVVEENPQLMKEVVVLGERQNIAVTEDTVTYTVDKFKSSEDRKLADVLKKMPGMEVNDQTGLIKYKGKSIETILLDGDDLFGKSYSVGTRSISADIVDQVEAIEDYQENTLKKGLQKSEKVVLNLKLKRNVAKVSGDASAGAGVGNYLANVNSILLSEKVKALGVAHANNISLNQTPYLKETYRSENSLEMENYGVDLLREGSVAQAPAMARSYANRLKFGALSLLYKPHKKVTLTNQFSLFSDVSTFEYDSRSSFLLGENSVEISNQTSNRALPTYAALTSKLSYKPSVSSSLEINNRYAYQADTYYQNNLQNNAQLFNTALTGRKRYYHQHISYSNKLSPTQLLEFTAYNALDQTNRTFLLDSPQPILVEGKEVNLQNLTSERSNRTLEAAYLVKINKVDTQLKLTQALDQENIVMAAASPLHKFQLRNSITALHTRVGFNPKPTVILSGLITLSYAKRAAATAQEPDRLQQNDFYINSEVKLRYKINESNSITLKAGKESKPVENRYLIATPLLLDSRTVLNNIPSLDLEDTWISSASYSHFNLFEQRNFTLFASYQETRNTWLAQQTITEGLSLITYFQTPLTRKDLNLSASAGYLIDAISHKVNLMANTNINQFYNALNGTSAQRTWLQVHTSTVELNSAFSGKFNYKSSWGITHIIGEQENTTPITTTNLTGRLESILKLSSKTYCKVGKELLLPGNATLDINQVFLDFSFHHFTKKIEYFVLAKNLLNRPAFTQVYSTEFSTSVFSNSLFRRYVVGGLNYTF
ncbi:hypothetical protein [Rufibacter sp. LB8]|uniref:hypothetical protein n=1 Tax=Rufibacter sp. LB8 TaxID=2777781 RepID=UPI00178C5A87|nr:hypothetical protein [Rufibacter sp. LB8]